MKEIVYTTSKGSGTILWLATESFNELEGKKFNLVKMEAKQIEKLNDISITAKILLSAVAGAVIQHLIDKGIDTDSIFSSGSFVVKK